MASPTLQGALKNDFGEAVVACSMPELCKFPSLDSCQKRFMWTHKRVYLAPHPAVSLVLQVGDAEKFPQALGFGGLDPFLRVSKQGPRFAATERMEVTRDLSNLNLLAKLILLFRCFVLNGIFFI